MGVILAVYAVVASHPDSFLTFRKELLIALAQQNEVYALAPAVSAEVNAALAAINVKTISYTLDRTGTNIIKDIATLVDLWKIYRRLKPDVVFCYTPKAVIYGSLAAKLAGVKSITSMLTGLGYAFAVNTWRSKIVRQIQKILYRAALACSSNVIFQNPDDYAEFCNHGLVNQKKCSVVNGSGVNLAEFAPVKLPEKIAFLMVSRLIKEKGIYEYITAAKKIHAQYPETIFYLVGGVDDKSTAITQEQVLAWHAAKIINYVGFLTDVRPAIAKSAVFVLPSYREGTPRAVLEAMAMGRAVITTDVPGCRETVRDGENGLLVPAADSTALEQAMLRLLTQPELVAKMGQKSREIAVAKYDVHLVNQEMLRIIAHG